MVKSRGLPTLSPSHRLPVTHEAVEHFCGAQSPGLEDIFPGHSQDLYPFPQLTNVGSIPLYPQDPFSYAQLPPGGQSFAREGGYAAGQFAPRHHDASVMPRNNSSSSGNAPHRGTSGTGAGVAKRQPGPTRQASNNRAQAISRAVGSQAGSPGQLPDQAQGFGIDLTGMDYLSSSPGTMGLYGSPPNPSLGPGSYDVGGYGSHQGVVGGLPQTPQRQAYRGVKFEDPSLLNAPGLISPGQYESFAEDSEAEPAVCNPARPRKRQASAALTDLSPATGNNNNNTNSPANNCPNTPRQGGGGGGGGGSSGSSGRATSAPQPPKYAAHVAPNRIQEAGPVRHPDPEWRPYGVNHWHVFLTEPTLLRYLSSTEIKDIREHCYELARLALGGEGAGEGEGQGGPAPVAEGSPYTTADARAVWRHCDAYVRRRGQVRNNQAARRSRQRKDAETRYWRAKAIEYGCPDHEFSWDEYEEAMALSSSPPAGQGGAAGASGSPPAEGSGSARARARGRQGQRQQQQGQGQGQGQGQAAARHSPGTSPVKPEFDFNQPFSHDDDRANESFDAFIRGF